LVSSGVREISLLSSRILSGPGLLRDRAALDAAIGPASKVFVLTDANCARYARPLAKGRDATLLAIPAGESRKTLATAAKVYDRMARAGLDRKSVLLAVGGGVITDLGGFVASTYLRGVKAVLVPTTLLGMVDAAVGGKTGVNLPQGKNLVGTFSQPRAVLCDVETLKTLPPREFTAGLGEVAKYGMIRDAELMGILDRSMDAIAARDVAALDEIVHRCAAIKADVVSQDEREGGLRAILNYGHTIGHAIEAAGRYRLLHHGEAVAVGMEAEAYIAMELGLAPLEVLAEQNRVLKRCGLPTRVKKLPRAALLASLKLDKKSEGGRPRFVLPEAVGRVRYGVDVPPELVLKSLHTVMR
jgi:3-dehydroquinate synthase